MNDFTPKRWERFPLACTWLVAREGNYGWLRRMYALNYVAAVVDDVASGRDHVSLDDVRFVLRNVLRRM